MYVLPATEYLGRNVKNFNANGIWINLVEYNEEHIPNTSHHAHLNAHITFLIQGGTLEKREGKEIYRKAGDAIFFESHEPHHNSKTAPKSKNINVEFESEFFKSYNLIESDLQIAIKNPDFRFSLLKIYQEMVCNDQFSANSITMNLLQLFEREKKVAEHSKVPKWILTIENLLQDKWQDHVSLVELSAECGVHPITISKYFPKYFSCTLGEYVRKIKVARSLYFIKNTGTSLTEAAFECGFADQSHFVRTFKSFTGLLPSEYRKL